MGRRNLLNPLWVAATSGGGAAPATVYVFRDDFLTAEVAPLTSPRTCEPGPGTITISDPDNTGKIENEWLSLGQVGKWTEMSAAGGSSVVTPGDAVTFKQNSNRYGAHLNYNSAIQGSIYGLDNVLYANCGSSQLKLGAYEAGVYEVAVTQTGTHRMLWAKWGAHIMQLVAVWATAAYRSEFISFAPAINRTSSYAAVRWWRAGGVWGTHSDFRLGGQTGIAAGTAVTVPANTYMQVSFTAPAGTANIYLRYVDDDNTWIMRVDFAGNTLKLIEKSGGVETERASWSGTQVASYHISLDDERISISGGSYSWVGYSSAFNKAATVLKADLPISATWWDIYMTPPTETSGLAPQGFVSYGDSKGTQGWQALVDDAAEPTAQRGIFEFGGYNHAGDMVSTLKAAIDASLAATTRTPEFSFVNIGANNLSATGIDQIVDANKAVISADFAYILDAIHTKWPNCRVKIAHVWRRNYQVTYTKMNGWFDEVIATRSWASVGLDETVVVEGGDDGATMTTDGLHYSTAGLTAVAIAWADSIGY